MEKSLILRVNLAIGLGMMLWLSPAWADSRSTTIKLSCVVAPAIGLSSASTPEKSAAEVWNNLEDQYHLDKTTRQTAQGPVELYSLTAL